MNALIRIGYWHSQDEPYWPDPAWFLDEQWEASVRQPVTAYLYKGRTERQYMGFSWCRFRCPNGRSIGTVECTDGVYIWPSGLPHYLEHHAVRLPDEFVTHALTSPGLPALIDRAELAERPVDTKWWREQRGWREGSSFRTYSDYGEVWVANLPTVLSKLQIMFLENLELYATIHAAPELFRRQWSLGRVKLESRINEERFLYLQRRAHALGLELIFAKEGNVHGTDKQLSCGLTPEDV